MPETPIDDPETTEVDESKAPPKAPIDNPDTPDVDESKDVPATLVDDPETTEVDESKIVPKDPVDNPDTPDVDESKIAPVDAETAKKLNPFTDAPGSDQAEEQPSVADLLDKKASPADSADPGTGDAGTDPSLDREDRGSFLRDAAAIPQEPDANDPYRQDDARPGTFFMGERPGATTGGVFKDVNQDLDSVETPPSTAEGQRLLNLIPLTNGYDREAVRRLPQGVPIIVVALRVTCGGLCSVSRNDSQFMKFEAAFRIDVVRACHNGTMKITIAEGDIEILNVVDVVGKTAIQVTIKSNASDPFQIVDELYRQLFDPMSTLRTQGTLTPNLDPEVWGSDVVAPLENDSRVRATSSTDAPAIVGVSVGLYLGLMGLFFAGYKQYAKRVKRDEIESRKLKSLKTWYYKSLKINTSSLGSDEDFTQIVESELLEDEHTVSTGESNSNSSLFTRAQVYPSSGYATGLTTATQSLMHGPSRPLSRQTDFQQGFGRSTVASGINPMLLGEEDDGYSDQDEDSEFWDRELESAIRQSVAVFDAHTP